MTVPAVNGAKAILALKTTGSIVVITIIITPADRIAVIGIIFYGHH